MCETPSADGHQESKRDSRYNVLKKGFWLLPIFFIVFALQGYGTARDRLAERTFERRFCRVPFYFKVEAYFFLSNPSAVSLNLFGFWLSLIKGVGSVEIFDLGRWLAIWRPDFGVKLVTREIERFRDGDISCKTSNKLKPWVLFLDVLRQQVGQTNRWPVEWKRLEIELQDKKLPAFLTGDRIAKEKVNCCRQLAICKLPGRKTK